MRHQTEQERTTYGALLDDKVEVDLVAKVQRGTQLLQALAAEVCMLRLAVLHVTPEQVRASIGT